MTDPTPEVFGIDHAHPDGLARAKAAMEAADKVSDRAERDQLSTARTRLNMASDNLHLAYFMEAQRGSWRDHAIRNLQTACDALGYDLVKRDD